MNTFIIHTLERVVINIILNNAQTVELNLNIGEKADINIGIGGDVT